MIWLTKMNHLPPLGFFYSRLRNDLFCIVDQSFSHFFMSHTDPPSVTGMHLVERRARSLTLSWSVSRRANPSTIRYKLMFCEKVRSMAITDHNSDHQRGSLFNKLFISLQDKDEAKTGKTYTVLVLEKNTAEIKELSPSTVYLFQVQALSPEGNVGSSSVEKEFSTLAEGKCRTDLKPTIFINTRCIYTRGIWYDGPVFYSDLT